MQMSGRTLLSTNESDARRNALPISAAGLDVHEIIDVSMSRRVLVSWRVLPDTQMQQ